MTVAEVDSLLTKNDAARILNCKLWTVDRLIDRGELPFVLVGERKRITRDDLYAFIERNRGFKCSGGA